MSDEEYFLAFWTPTCGEAEARRAWDVKQSQKRISAPMVMGDIAPYQSMIDGSMIESRSKHRAHLKEHGCIEVGNETKFLSKGHQGMKSPDGLKQTLIDQVSNKLRY